MGIDMGIFGNKRFAVYYFCSMFSAIGTQVSNLAIPWLVMKDTQSIKMMSLTWISEILPLVIVSPFLGVFIDRWNKKRVLLFSDLSRIILVTAIPVFSLVHLFSLWILFTVVFLLSIASQSFSLVSDFALLPFLVRKHELTQANSAMSSMSSLSSLLGPAVGGAVISFLGPVNALLIDSLTYFSTLLLVLFLPFSPQISKNLYQLTIGMLLGEIKTGLALIYRSKILRVLSLVSCIGNLAVGARVTILTYHFGVELHLDSKVVGITYAIMGASTVLSSFIATFLSRKITIGRAITLNMIGAVVGMGLMALPSSLHSMILGLIVVSMTINLTNIYTFTIRQFEIPMEFIGRANSVYRMVLSASYPLSAVILGGVTSSYGSHAAFLVSAVLLSIAVLLLPLSNIGSYKIKDDHIDLPATPSPEDDSSVKYTP
ncbi:MFS transporter [Alicyclobacillus fastidiosus]|nr:MFS transporter [Alicyclobacillus fastidiosus]WEH11528.1 MFS transporter [Alicyclobacillus fastidiosus]